MTLNNSACHCERLFTVTGTCFYDQVWLVRGHRHNTDADGSKDRHSAEAISLVKQFVEELEEIPDGCAELFPFEMIDELRREYLDP